MVQFLIVPHNLINLVGHQFVSQQEIFMVLCSNDTHSYRRTLQRPQKCFLNKLEPTQSTTLRDVLIYVVHCKSILQLLICTHWILLKITKVYPKTRCLCLWSTSRLHYQVIFNIRNTVIKQDCQLYLIKSIIYLSFLLTFCIWGT